jgi:limonene-1,2-epoxide hydrolase
VTDPSLAQRLADVLVALTPEQPGAIERLRELYDPAMVFQDPIQKLRGLDAFMSMNQRLLARMRTLEWTILAVGGQRDEAFVEWEMRGKAKLGPSVHVSGVTRARAQGGRIVDHRDYWDMGELIASALPGGQRLLHLFRAPFA